MVDTRLWCLHHIGADDVHPAPDFDTAQKWANWANERFAEHADISRFVVAVWPWAATSHAEGLERSIAEWTVPCPSCAGLNLSCPNGCERDPDTGELRGIEISEGGKLAIGEEG